MKLNLLPVTVSRGAKTRTAWIASSLIILAGIGGCVVMMIKSANDLKAIKEEVAAARPQAERAAVIASQADTIIQQAAPYVRNTTLANAVLKSNSIYPRLYENLFNYIPPFFRIYSITALPAGAENASVTMQGTLTSYQQYADLMLALMRNPNVLSVSRSGFASTDLMVPALQPTDQVGKPRRPNEAPIPDDPLDRLSYFQSQGAVDTQAYRGVGNFGSQEPSTRFAMPGESAITITLLMKASLQVPNPTDTLKATATGAAGGAAPGAVPGGTPAAMTPGGAPTPSASAGGADEDEGLKGK